MDGRESCMRQARHSRADQERATAGAPQSITWAEGALGHRSAPQQAAGPAAQCRTAAHYQPPGRQAIPSTYPKPTLQHRNALPATDAPGHTFQARSPAAPSPAVMSARASRLIIVGAAAGSGSGSPRPASAARSATDAAGSARPSACS